jgi:hypothetical protein
VRRRVRRIKIERENQERDERDERGSYGRTKESIHKLNLMRLLEYEIIFQPQVRGSKSLSTE